ncbi:MAG: DUF4412 domain-containing protein [Bacteroidia bacterium]
MKNKQTSFGTITAICLLLMFFVGTSSVFAQINVGNKVKRKVDQRVDRKVDEAIDDALDNIFNKKKKEAGEVDTDGDGNPDTEISSDENGNVTIKSDESEVTISMDEEESAPVAVQPSTFIGSFTLSSSEYKSGKLKKDNPVTMNYHIDKFQFATEMESQDEDVSEMIMIYDRQTRKSTMKMIKGDEKTAMITKIPNIKVGVSNTSVDKGTYSVTPTGKTRVIEGYNCKEYIVETDKEINHVWLTEEISMDVTSLTDFVKVKDSNGGMTDFTNVYKINGFMLESHIETKGKDETTDIFIKNLKIGSVNAGVFSTDGYTVTDMSSLGSMFGK